MFGKVLAALAAPVLLFTPLAAPAQAAPLERDRYSDTDSDEFDCEGLPVSVENTFQGLFMLKAPKAEGAPPRLFDNYNLTQIFSVEGSDRTLTITHQGLYKDLRITQVEGDVYQFVAIEAGQPFVIRDETGKVLLRDRGLLKTTFRVDTQGDTDLENDEFIEDSFEVLMDAGDHPGFYFDFCGYLKDYFLP